MVERCCNGENSGSIKSIRLHSIPYTYTVFPVGGGGGGGGEVKVASAQTVATLYLDVGPIRVGEWHASYCCVSPVLVVMCIYTCILLHGI